MFILFMLYGYHMQNKQAIKIRRDSISYWNVYYHVYDNLAL